MQVMIVTNKGKRLAPIDCSIFCGNCNYEMKHLKDFIKMNKESFCPNCITNIEIE